MEQKICKKCGILKDIEEYPKHSSYTSGRENSCKSCHTYYQDNKEERKDKQKEYDNKHYEERKPYRKEYNENHKEETNARSRFRYATDFEYQTKNKLRVRIYNALNGKIKQGSTLELIGCSIDEFRDYMEEKFNLEMNWDNWGSYWEIDHIIPCSSFDLTTLEQQKECFHYTNCQPLTIGDNRKKHAKIII